jgi:CDP-glycerol glycerophosphotransferase (TagB/SpsB family)
MSMDSTGIGVDERQKTTASGTPSTEPSGPAGLRHGPMMPRTASEGAAGGSRPRPDWEVTAVHWERIQLILRLRRRGTAEPFGEPMLRRADGSAPALRSRPVDQPEDEAERLARFNVFVGHDQMPLEPGAWELVLDGGGRSHEPTVVPAAPALQGPVVRDFAWYEVVYRVRLVPAGDGPLRVEIDVDRGPRRGMLTRVRDARSRAWQRLFALLVGAVQRLPGRRRTILFTSDSRTELGGNLQLVHDRLTARGIDRRYPIRTIFKQSIRARRSPLDRVRLVWLMARARAILLDDYQPAIYRLPRHPEQRIIQLWHAWGAFKTVGYSRIGKPGGPNPWSRVHKNYTFATVSSTHEVPFYAEAFGIADAAAVPTGTPRMDDFLDPANQAARRERALDLVPSARGHEVIMFAPTFRGRSARGADYPVEIIDVRALHAVCAERDAIAILRLHPFVTRRVDVPPELRDRVIEATDLAIDTNDLLLITDLLVTDYSSLIFEFSALGRPMLFFAYDLEEYVATRDFYEPYETFVPGLIVRTFEELVGAILRGDFEQHRVAPFARRHLPDEPGSATDRIIDELILGDAS